MVESILLVIALSFDSFLASLAYGAEKIKIPMKSAILISLIGVLCLGVSLYMASYMQQYLPQAIASIISFTMFFLIGLSSLFQGTIKSLLQRCQQKKVQFSCKGIFFVLDIYVETTKADLDHSKRLSLKEAFYLAIALSIDSFLSGFAFGIHIHNPIPVLCFGFCMGFVVILAGSCIGRKITAMANWNLSWLSGVLFIFLAFTKIL